MQTTYCIKSGCPGTLAAERQRRDSLSEAAIQTDCGIIKGGSRILTHGGFVRHPTTF